MYLATNTMKGLSNSGFLLVLRKCSQTVNSIASQYPANKTNGLPSTRTGDHDHEIVYGSTLQLN